VSVEQQDREAAKSPQGDARPLAAVLARLRRHGALVELPLLVIAALVITLVVKAFLAQAFYIPSASMEPQLREHDRVVVSRTAYRLHDPRRGDIVVFPSPAVPAEDEGVLEGVLHDVLEAVALRDPGDRELIKRIVGLPGETVEARDGQVVIDGRRLVEPYLPPGVVTSDFGPIEVPDGRVFVMGDNRPNSHDSRFPDIGPIDVESIVGRAIARVWPPGRTAFL
jgi:signal peptidase I